MLLMVKKVIDNIKKNFNVDENETKLKFNEHFMHFVVTQNQLKGIVQKALTDIKLEKFIVSV